ncbi:sulfite exporter TauE/SafE family protein [Solwaraspora sp. WMMD1047]|uniref:sulfite exporter TauE/SafE family protein n=1 Tax=Solwaraspora sp. WMMD1047 TaxID=3016102 RepID=UPI002415D914|nr:sulfite exporter TauE/SafE family protein [Solwaraspora sp. WMMD1047]MDG4831940.1 sulfite exporter TauE/SafE family protein [Solwaraspora sp. WMMD1047]
MDWVLAIAGLAVGIVVGLTGMGGGALMTPMLVLFFGIPPLAAVSSDLVVSAVMKPVGGLVHIRRGTVNWSLVGWLCVGSVPAAFTGVLLLRAVGDGERLQGAVKIALGIALLVATAGLVYRAYTRMVEHAARRRAAAAGAAPAPPPTGPVLARPVPTVLVGAVGGLIVGMTSVGSGSLIIIALLMLYPLLHPGSLVGTDLVQAVPLVAAAALGHLLFGDFRLDLTASLLIGAVPGAWLGAQLSTRAPGGLVRRALAVVLLASGLKLLGVPNGALLVGLAAALGLGSLAWMAARRRHGLPALARAERRAARLDPPAAPDPRQPEPATAPGPQPAAPGPQPAAAGPTGAGADHAGAANLTR